MTKYHELCSAFTDQGEAVRNYWEALQLRAGQIAIGLWQYLEYPQKNYLSLDGKTSEPYVVLTNRGEKKSCHFHELKGSNGAVQFDILVTVEENPGVFPKGTVRFSFNMGREGDSLRIWDDSGTIDTLTDIGSPGNENLYDQIFSALKVHLSSRPSLQKG